MPRWEYDTVFYRVSCVTLFGVAFTFTVILTNVFMDIDGLLFKKNEEKTENFNTVQTEDLLTQEDEYQDISDVYDAERSKRSLKNEDFSFHIKDPNTKKVITDRLAELLDELDHETATNPNNNENNEPNNKLMVENIKNIYKTNINDNDKYKETDTTYDRYKHEPNSDNRGREILKEMLDKENLGQPREDLSDIEIFHGNERILKAKGLLKKQNEDELKHLAVHNIILQGIIAHMDLGDVYARVHHLINNLENTQSTKDNFKEILYPVNNKWFFNELINCKQLKDEIEMNSAKTETTIRETTPKPRVNNVMIKTIIDITSLTNDKTNQDAYRSKENVNGIFKLIYNGNTLKFKKVDEVTSIPQTMLTQEKENAPGRPLDNKSTKFKITDINQKGTSRDSGNVSKINNILKDILQRYSRDTESVERTAKTAKKRLKRHVNIRYDNKKTTTKKLKEKVDDELFVEIETHFDSKGMNGEKKKKVIRDLIDKIQKAIHSDQEVKKNKNKLHLHVKKRIQHPLDSKSDDTFINQISMSPDNIIHRDLEPIGKSVPLHEKLPYISDEKGHNWKKYYNGPRFLTESKGINSAEMGEIDTDYNKLMDNGIPQRLQEPLNTDSDDEMLITNNPGDIKYVMKNIAGSGFSIGFNQYVDEPPDAESMKLFTGIENIIKTYHQTYDAADTGNGEVNTRYDNLNPEYHEPLINKHTAVRRSIKQSERDHRSNESKVIFNKNFLNYKNYQDVYNESISKTKGNKNYSLFINEDIINKNLNPAEIFSLADLLERKKRSLKLKEVPNNKKKLNSDIKAKVKVTNLMFLKKKRSKRHINKIRIIAKDLSKHHKHNSEDVFMVSSDENMFADRAVIKEVETPTFEQSGNINEEYFDIISPQEQKQNMNIMSPQTFHEDHFDLISPRVTETHYDIISPYIFEASPQESYSGSNIFTRRSRHNSLMSKYPHLFMKEISRSKEDYNVPDSSFMYGKVVEKFPVTADVIITTQDTPHVDGVQTELKRIPMPQYGIPASNNLSGNKYSPETSFRNQEIQEIINSFPPSPQDNSNYKVTVKIMPKNNTGINSGFKEIRTSINKSYDKNGLKYTSLVNVSEVSKVEKLNKSKDYAITHSTVQKLKKEQQKIQSLIKQHKDRIDEQLAHLHKEKEKIERIDVKNAELILKDDNIDDTLPTNPARFLHNTKQDFIALTSTTKEPTTILTTTKHVGPTTVDPGKVKIMNTIELNEKITNEILKKIDKSTDLLQTFIEKLVKQMVVTSTQKPEEKTFSNLDTDIHNKVKINEESQLSDSYRNVPRSNDVYDQIPNLFFSPVPKESFRNGTVGIPFIYAFQQPYTLPNNKDTPIASVVYHGHVHSNTLNIKKEDIQTNNRKFWKGIDKAIKHEKHELWKTESIKPVMNNINNVKNSSKFFIDDLENDYKVLPVVGKSISPEAMVNITKV